MKLRFGTKKTLKLPYFVMLEWWGKRAEMDRELLDFGRKKGVRDVQFAVIDESSYTLVFI